MSRFTFWMVVVASFGVGCSKPKEPKGPLDAGKPQQTNVTPTDKDQQQTNTDEKTEPAAPTDKTRRSLAGRWFLVLSLSPNTNGQRRDHYSMLLDLSTEDGKSYQAKVLAGDVAADEPGLKTAAFTAESASFTTDLGDTALDFNGSLKDGVVWGNVLLGGRQCEPARLIPTEAESLDDFTEPQDAPGNDALDEVFRIEENRLAGLKRFCQLHPESPLALDAYQQVLFLAKQEKTELAEVEKTAEAYVKLAGRWGERMTQLSRILVGLILSRTKYFPELALKYFEDAETGLTDDSPDSWKSLIENGKSKVQTALAIRKISEGTKEQQQQAVEMLRSRLKQNGFDHLILYALADHAEKQEQVDEAMRRYAQLATLPRLSQMLQYELSDEGVEVPDPSETVARLWEKKHGKTDGLDEYLNQVYKESIYSFAGEKAKPRPADGPNRVVLCELFTGAQCPPCMAADVATGGLEAAAEKSEVIVLRYHVRIPGPDPLENEDSWARFPYYNPRGTPTTCVNGKSIEGVGGPMLDHVAGSYARLREAVDPILAEKTDVKIKLTADAKDGVLAVAADITGIEKPSDTLRLRLVLAEDEIEYLAGNRIRLHEMVVRSMPGGVDGVKPENGKLSYSESIKLADFKQRLVDYLTTFEKQEAQLFPVKPLELKKLHLVGFVQDDDTKEVLQAAAVPVTGKLEYPAEKKAAQPEPKPKAGDEKTDKKEKPQPQKGPKLTPPKTNPTVPKGTP